MIELIIDVRLGVGVRQQPAVFPLLKLLSFLLDEDFEADDPGRDILPQQELIEGLFFRDGKFQDRLASLAHDGGYRFPGPHHDCLFQGIDNLSIRHELIATEQGKGILALIEENGLACGRGWLTWHVLPTLSMS